MRVNLQLCFPDQSPEERNAVALHCFESMGMGVLEIVMAWWAQDPREHCRMYDQRGWNIFVTPFVQGAGCCSVAHICIRRSWPGGLWL